MSNYLRKVDKINYIMILSYGGAIILTMFHLSYEKIFVMMIDFVLSMVILLYVNQLIKHEPILHRSPLYYYLFLFLVTISVYLDGGHSSPLFPAIFFIPALYISVNFSRRGSTGIGIFAATIIWLTLFQDPNLEKLQQTIIVSISILALPQIVGYLVKEYVEHMKELVRLRKISIDE